MSDRLRHLQRQQALLREHLAWIETEIARETSAIRTPATGTPANETVTMPAASAAVPTPTTLVAPTPATPLTPTATTTAAGILPEADALIERYAREERQNPQDIRRGCFLAFITAFLLLAGSVTAVWLIYYRES